MENYFKTRIITLYSDNGGEFMGLGSFLSIHGISHLTSPPHTPEHNGLLNVIIGILSKQVCLFSLKPPYLSHFGPTPFSQLFINRLPTPTLQVSSPYLQLFGIPPNYLKLRAFGCLCYPWLRPYTSHKLEPRSLPCIFPRLLTYSKYIFML